jgi:limonene-1,2-epoxide hydrolase
MKIKYLAVCGLLFACAQAARLSAQTAPPGQLIHRAKGQFEKRAKDRDANSSTVHVEQNAISGTHGVAANQALISFYKADATSAKADAVTFVKDLSASAADKAAPYQDDIDALIKGNNWSTVKAAKTADGKAQGDLKYINPCPSVPYPATAESTYSWVRFWFPLYRVNCSEAAKEAYFNVAGPTTVANQVQYLYNAQQSTN